MTDGEREKTPPSAGNAEYFFPKEGGKEGKNLPLLPTILREGDGIYPTAAPPTPSFHWKRKKEKKPYYS